MVGTHTHTLTDTPRLANGHTQPQTHRYMYPQTDRHKQTYVPADRQTDTQKDNSTDRWHTDTQTDRHTDTQIDTLQPYTHTHMDTQILFSMIGAGFADLARGCVVLLGLFLVSVFCGPGVRGWWARGAGWERLGG